MADSDSDDDIYISNQVDTIEDELITYLEEKRADRKVSLLNHLNVSLLLSIISLYFFNIYILIYLKIKPLDYWKSNSSRFPILALIARKYLGISASSAASERFFSQGALIITKLRNRLNKSTFEMISCLKSWGVFIDEVEKAKKEEKYNRNLLSEEDNQFIIIENK
jgi:hypothetical protein